MKRLNYSKIKKFPRVNTSYHFDSKIHPLSNREPDSPLVRFGKHKGKTWKELDSSYLYWTLTSEIHWNDKSCVLDEIERRNEKIWNTFQAGKSYRGTKWENIPYKYLEWVLSANFSSSIKNISRFYLRRRNP